MHRALGAAAVVSGLAYLVVTAWAMVHVTYDLWGALIVAPVIVAVTVPLLRGMFGDDRSLLAITSIGLLAKFAGGAFRYWVAFDAYGGAADAGRYHLFGKALAGAVRSGQASVLELVPSDVGTPFVERLTALVYTLVGSSRLAGFLLFGWLGYWGAILFLRAATVAVPGLALHRYALLLCFAPTMVYWPSSIGKEAWMCATLGLASYGFAYLLTGRFGLRYVAWAALGTTGAGFVRPHFAAIWVGAVVVALVVAAVAGGVSRRPRSRVVNLLVAALAVVGLVVVAGAALRYLDPGDGGDSTTSVTTKISDIFDETTRRSEQGGSGFQTISLSSPQMWPWAVFRTLTRPLLVEARSFAELLPAAEMTALLVVAVASWRRFAQLPRMLRSSPYLVFSSVVLLLFGVAFTSIGNLGILTRQRSLVMPLFLLPLCLPPRPMTTQGVEAASGRRPDLVTSSAGPHTSGQEWRS